MFGADYAAAYDELYEDKNYLGECDLIERVFQKIGPRTILRVLDLGCGTGGHAVPLAQRGYDVLGVDRSSEMLQRAAERGSEARFTQGDITTLRLDEKFDAVLMMFAVLGYQCLNADVLSALATARYHLSSGGLLFADVWYGPAVLAQRPSERVKVIDTPDGSQLIRVATSSLETRHDVCSVHYRLWRIARGRVTSEVNEQHRMRYFFGPELESLLEQRQFKLLRLGAFPGFFDDDASERTWSVAFAARAV